GGPTAWSQLIRFISYPWEATREHPACVHRQTHRSGDSLSETSHMVRPDSTRRPECRGGRAITGADRGRRVVVGALRCGRRRAGWPSRDGILTPGGTHTE